MREENMRPRSVHYRSYSYIISSVLPVLLMLAVYAFVGIAPFGGKSLLTIDMDAQYTSFFASLKDVFKPGHSALYSWSKALGGNYVGLFSYYMASPFSAIVFLFSKRNLPWAVFWITLLKVSAAGLTAAVYFTEKNRQRWLQTTLISTCYAMCAYMLTYQQNTLWIDGMICLPLILLGIEHILRHRGYALYTLSLLAAIIANYYIGYMLCIFSVLFFIYRLLLSRPTARGLWTIHKRSIGGFAAASIAAVAASAWITLPTFFSLLEDKANFRLSRFRLTFNFTPVDFFSKLFLGSYDMDETMTGLPNIFCGMLVLLCAAAYFFNRGISIRRKALTGGLLGVLFCCLWFNPLNLVWHMFQYPVWYPYRYSFMFSFLLLILANHTLINWEGISRWVWAVPPAFMILSGVAAGKGYSFLTPSKLIATLAWLLFYCLFYWILSKKNGIRSMKKAVIVGVCVLLPGELVLNGYWTLEWMNYREMDVYTAYVDEMLETVDYVKERESDVFYRMESNNTWGYNYSMLLDFNGATHYSSTGEKINKRFMGCLGNRNNGNWSNYNGETLVSDALLGIKYFLAKPSGLQHSHYDMLDWTGEVTIYENPYALPLGYLVDDTLMEVGLFEGAPFAFQNVLVEAMSGVGDVFTPLDEGQVEMELMNMSWRYNEQGEMEFYKTGGEEDQHYVEFQVAVQEGGPTYFYPQVDTFGLCRLYVNGSAQGYYFNTFQHHNLCIGSGDSPGMATVRFVPEEDKFWLEDNQFFQLNMALLSQAYDRLSKYPLRITENGGHTLTGEITLDQKGLLFTTIPYNEGWRIEVDGEKVQPLILLETFIGLELEAGEHEIVFYHIPQGLITGILLSGIGILYLIIFLWTTRRRNRR